MLRTRVDQLDGYAAARTRPRSTDLPAFVAVEEEVRQRRSGGGGAPILDGHERLLSTRASASEIRFCQPRSCRRNGSAARVNRE